MVKLMKKTIIAVAVLLVAAAFLVGAGAAAQGEIIINCNADGANVTVYDAGWNSVAAGVVSGGHADIYVDTAKGATYATISANGYEPKTIGVSVVAGTPSTYTVNLTEVPQTIGGSFGFIQVLTNVIGADVKLLDISGNESARGVTDNTGAATIKIMLVGTPVKSVVVSANGYTTKQLEIGTLPAPGETLQMVVKLDSDVKPTVPTPQPTTPMPVIGILAGLGAAAVVLLKRRA